MLISFVIPVYNAENTLRKCVNSLLNQTYDNYEIILVNDGSTDKSLKICEDFANNPKVFLINQKNSGVSKTRNKGIEKSKGDYICFIDSDDWVEEKYLEKFIKNLKVNTTLLVQDIFRDTSNKRQLNAGYKENIVNLNSYKELFVDYKLLRFGYPFGKFYSKEIIEKENLRFIENIQYGEDLIFFISYLNEVNQIHFISEAQYHYIVEDSNNSLSHSYGTFESELKCFDEFVKKCDTGFLNEKNLKEHSHFIFSIKGRLLSRAIESMYRPKTKKNNSSRIDIIKSLCTSSNKIYFQNHNKSGLKKLSTYLFKKEMIRLLDFHLSILFFIRYNLGEYWPIIRKIFIKNKAS